MMCESEVVAVNWRCIPLEAGIDQDKVCEFMERTLQTIKDASVLMVNWQREVVQDDPEPGGGEYPDMRATGRKALTIFYKEKGDDTRSGAS